jgi:hypothetical protein
MIRSAAFLSLFFLVFTLYSIQCRVNEYSFSVFDKTTEGIVSSIYFKVIEHSSDMKVESHEFLTHPNPSKPIQKNEKNNVTLHNSIYKNINSGFLKYYSFRLTNALIQHGREAIFFPFHYFW